jgi:MFS superfamily sulfate permease-like transporter
MQAAKDLRHDLPASVVVFFVAVPLCLGIALASGAPLFSGLIAGIIGGVVVGALSGSSLGVSGPAAGLAVIVLDAIIRLGSFQTFLLAVVIAGVLQIAFGIARAGEVGYFFPTAVIKGMLSGIGLLIILKQIPHAFGWNADPVGDFAFFQTDGETTFSEILRAFEHIEPSSLLVASIALGILLLWDRVLVPRGGLFRLLQGPLVAVGFGILFQLLTLQFAPGWALSGDLLVNVPVAQNFSELTALFAGPDWSQIGNPAVYATAMTIAVVASLETLLSVEATDKLDPQKRVTPANRELVAQGTGNIVSGLIGGLPVTQVIVRSSANIQSGARSKISTIIHGVLLLVFALALPTVLNLIPLAVLASILLVVGYKLARFSLFVSMFRMGPQQYVPFVVTIGGMLATDLLTGVVLGLAVAVVIILHRSYLNSHFLHIETQDAPGSPHRVRVRFAEQVTFLSRGAILRQLSEIPEGSHVVLDLSRTITIDQDVLEIVQDFENSAVGRGLMVDRIDHSEGTHAAVYGLHAQRPHHAHQPSSNGASSNVHPHARGARLAVSHQRSADAERG